MNAFSSRPFSFYFMSNTLALLGIWIQKIGVGWLTWEMTESTFWTSFVTLALMAPAGIIGPFFAVLAAGTGGADTTGGYITKTTPDVGGYTGPRTYDFDPGAHRRAGGNRPDRPGGFTDPGAGSYGPWKAEGGRIGYQEGELVEDESMMEATPTGMMEENIEEVQGEPSREQLEAIALEIFRLPLEQLNEQQLEVVYQAAMEQEPSEEEVQFAAQEGPGEGIASLV